jgi:hypothetical protein
MAPSWDVQSFSVSDVPLIFVRRRRGHRESAGSGELPSPSAVSSAARLPPSILDYEILSQSRDVISRSLGHVRECRLIASA